MQKIRLKETVQIGRVLDKQSKFGRWSGIMGVRNSFPLTKVSLFHFSSPKKKIKPFEKCSYPGQKNRFPIFPPKKVAVYFITPRQKFSFFIFHHSSSALDQNGNTRFCKNEWVLEINVMWIGFYSFSFFAILWQERKQAEGDSINPYRKKKKKRNERSKEKNLSRSFFHCDWARKGVPECLSIPLSLPRVTRLFSCM